MNKTNWESVIGLEVHAELKTATKMFCSCPVVDVISARPNSAVCPVCLGLPGALPVINRKAVELGVRAGLALGCEILPTSIFARKNYFYPDLPKGYQISQYETPLAVNGIIQILTASGSKTIHIRRAHLEEDTGKLTHIHQEKEDFSLVDLNRAGIPLLEIVTEPDMRSVEEAKNYAQALHHLLRYIDVSTCDMERGAIRFEANISIREAGSDVLNTRTEIKNLNSFRTLELALQYEIQRQIQVVESGGRVIQETVGWDDANAMTFSQRSKEEAHDYRYFPEPDLPPLVVDDAWLKRIREELPEKPDEKLNRFRAIYGLSEYDLQVLVNDPLVADYFEKILASGEEITAKAAANWLTGEVFSLMKQNNEEISHIKVSPIHLAGLIAEVENGRVNQRTAKQLLVEMYRSGKPASELIAAGGHTLIKDEDLIQRIIQEVLDGNPIEVKSYLAGKETLLNWFFGQAMTKARGQASPEVVRKVLLEALLQLKNN